MSISQLLKKLNMFSLRDPILVLFEWEKKGGILWIRERGVILLKMRGKRLNNSDKNDDDSKFQSLILC